MRRLAALVTCALVACALVGAGAAVAEVDQSRLEPPDTERYLRWGPLRVRPRIALRNLGYDNNILYTSAAEQVGDYTATLTPRLEGLVLFGSRAFLTFEEQLDYTVYLENSDQNYLDNRTAGRITVPFSNFGLFVDVSGTRRRSRPVDREDIRNRETERRITAGGIARLGWRTEVEVGFGVGDITNTDPDFAPTMPGDVDPIARRLDRSDESWTIDADYRVRGRTTLLLETLYKTLDFDYPFQTGGVTLPRDTIETRWQVGARFGEGGRLVGTVLAGLGRIDAEDPSLPDLDEAVGELELAYRLTGRTRMVLEGSRLPGFAVTEGNSYYLDTRVGLRMLHYLNRIVGLEAGARTGTLTFPETAGGGDPRKDDLNRYELGVRLRLAENSMGRRVEYRVRLQRYERTSNVVFANQDQTTFAIDAVVGF